MSTDPRVLVVLNVPKTSSLPTSGQLRELARVVDCAMAPERSRQVFALSVRTGRRVVEALRAIANAEDSSNQGGAESSEV